MIQYFLNSRDEGKPQLFEDMEEINMEQMAEAIEYSNRENARISLYVDNPLGRYEAGIPDISFVFDGGVFKGFGLGYDIPFVKKTENVFGPFIDVKMSGKQVTDLFKELGF